MSQATRNFMIGITSMAGLIGLVVLLFFFGELEAVVKPRYQLIINGTHAAGLRAGSAIELYGVPIGVVHLIEATDDPQYPVRIVGLIDQAVRIPREAEPFATASLLGGSATLQLEVLARPTGAALPDDGSARIDGEIRSRLIEQITDELDSRIAPLVQGMEEFRQLAQNLNDLVRPPDPTQPADVRNIHTAVDLLNDVLLDVREALTLAKEWLGDEQLRIDARKAVANANVLIDQATRTLDQFAKLAARLEADSDAVAKRLVPVLDKLALTLEDARAVAQRATEGEGTIAQLLNNPDLYRSLNDAAARLERALIEIQLLVEKFKAEGVPVQF